MVADQALANNIFRTSVLTNFHSIQGGLDEVEAIPGVSYKDVNGLAVVAMKMPDGTTEYWAQTDKYLDSDSGFKYVAFERRNQDGSVYLDDKGARQTLVSFPGNTFFEKDVAAVQALVKGKEGEAVTNGQLAAAEKAMQDLAKRIRERDAEVGAKQQAGVTVGGHSYGGGLAMAGKIYLEKNNIAVKETLGLDTFGAGEWLQRIVDRELKSWKEKNPGAALSADQEKQKRLEIAENVIKGLKSIYDSNGNMTHVRGGDDPDTDNMARLGQVYTLYTGTGEKDQDLAGHFLQNWAVNAKTENLKMDKSTPVASVLAGGGALSPQEQQNVQMLSTGLSMMPKNMPVEKNASVSANLPVNDKSLFENLKPTKVSKQVQNVAVDNLKILGDYLKEKKLGDKSLLETNADLKQWNGQLNEAVGKLTALAQLNPAYAEAYAKIYKKTKDGLTEGKDSNCIDLMPGPATLAALEKLGVPKNVIQAMKDLKLLDKDQGNDLYTVPDNALEILKAVQENPQALAQNIPPKDMKLPVQVAKNTADLPVPA